MSCDDDTLLNECLIFVRYLTGQRASDYVTDKYRSLHRAMQTVLMPDDEFDARLLEWAVRSALCARIADSYSRRFLANSLIRRKLALLIAVLENSPTFHQRMTGGEDKPLPLAIMQVIVETVRTATATLAGVVLLGPRHLLCRIGPAGAAR